MSAKHTLPAQAWPIPGAPGYFADNRGIIWSGSGWRGNGVRQLAAEVDRYGYEKVRLVVAGKRVKRAVHVLVALTFLGPRPSPTHEVRHLDGNSRRNCSSNLAWGTRAENAQDRVRHGRTYRPDWSDPAKRERWSAAMRNGKPRGAAARRSP